MDAAQLIVNFAMLIATAGAAAIAWWQAIAAGRARSAAEAAEEAALEAWKEASTALTRANSIADVTVRGPYAWALYELGTAILSARWVGESHERVMAIMHERITGLTEKSFSAGDAPISEIQGWVGKFSRFVDLGDPRDVDTWMDAVNLVGERVRLWHREPERAAQIVTEDPRYVSPFD